MTNQYAMTYGKPTPLTWLITGCSSGLGLELTRIVQAHGDYMIATSRNPSRTPDLVEEVKSHGGQWHALDVDDPTAPMSLLGTLEATGHHVDVLVNNAGVITFGVLEQLVDQDLRGQMETLYFGPQRLIRSVLPSMRQRRFGVIVNISSGASLDGNASMGAYAAAKAALDASTRVLAKEVSSFNIRPLTVWLGTFNTNIGNVSKVVQSPLPGDYRGSAADQLMEGIMSGKFIGNGDKEKAAKAIYEIVVGQGAGNGHEAEQFLPLGRDMIPRVGLVRDQYSHALEVFGDVSGSVHLDSK
ncbi:Short-chain dehydrogenase/reductase SDR [Penicillium verhagenii]|uniref:Short-chain dehydrogenase/reductase SDR n=1 Tax=Penicillium verhagenii TaxID=1562060 RepID=UPI0025456F74|nr:Short-chain dehydrogenase/reductase SDR [Penicillium verhagenii]KAJ5920834.1 Short-chain dehydrogenase/reductase SDR [Penicillium verhagenii]